MVVTLIFILFSLIFSTSAWAEHGGIYQRMSYKDLTDQLTVNIDHPRLTGIDFAIPWARLEPEEGKFNWEGLDKIIEPWEKAGKKVVVNIITLTPRGNPRDPHAGHATPNWVFKKGARDITIKEDGTKEGRSGGRREGRRERGRERGEDGGGEVEVDYPLFWDRIYLQEYEKFIKEFAKRYDGHPAIDVIGIGIAKLGGLTVIDPKVEKGEGERLKNFYMQNGYSAERWKTTIREIIGIYKSIFSKTPVRLTLSHPFEVKKDRADKETFSFLEDLAAGAAPQGVHLFHQAVTSREEIASSFNRVFNKYCDRTLLGAELVNPIYGTKEENRKHMGNIMTAVKNALGEGAAAPASCIGYLNLYVADVTASNPNSSLYDGEWGKAVEYAISHLRKDSKKTEEKGTKSP